MRESAIAADEIRLVTRDELGFRYKLDLVAAGLARTDDDVRQGGGAATATVHAGLTTSGRCELVGVGGMASARSDEEVVAMSQWASVCLAWDDSGYTSLDHRLDWDLTPRLLATPRFRAGPQRRETVGWDFIGTTIRIREDQPSEHYTEHLQQGAVRLQTAVGWVDGDPRYDVDVGLSVMLRTYIRTYADDDPPLSISVVGMGLTVLKLTGDEEDPTVAGMPLELGRIEGLRVGGGVRLGARFGGFVGGMMRGRKDMVRDELAPIAEGALSAERTLARGFVLRVAGERKFSPLWDARIAIDNRATTSLTAERGALKAKLVVAAGVTELRAIAERTYVRTGGVTAEAQYTLTKYLDVRARSEVGRSLYAPGAMGAPQWASETMLMLAAHTP